MAMAGRAEAGPWDCLPTGRNAPVGETDTEKRDPERDPEQDQEQEEKKDEKKEEPLEPTVSVEDLGAWKRRLTVEVAAEKVTAEYEKQLKQLSRTADVPGFRRGRVPRKLLLNRFGEALTGDVKGRLVALASGEALEANELEPVSEPLFGPAPPEPEKKEGEEGVEEEGEKEAEEKVEEKADEKAAEPPSPVESSTEYLKDLELKPEEAFCFEFAVEVKPTFDLPEYKGLKLTRRTRPVTGERVDTFIDGLRRHEADFEPVEKGAIEPGDRLTVRASMDCDGEKVWEAENEIAHVTEDALLGLPGIVEYSDVEGMKLDDEKTFDVKVVDGFKEEALRGRDATLTVRIVEIKRPVLPPLDDEAARRLGAPDAESLRRQARERLELQARADARDDIERQIADELVGAVEFDLPEGLLQQQSQRQEIRQMLRLAQMGIGPDAIEEEYRESIRASARESAERSMKLGLILAKIAESEEIEVTDDELENQIYRYALAQRRTPVSVRSELERSGRLDDMRAEMRAAKVVNFIAEQADITDAQEDPAAAAEAGGAAGPSEGGAQ